MLGELQANFTKGDAMITEQEAREAATCIADIGNGTDGIAARRLAALVIQILFRLEAERAERAKPVTPEWCLSHGAKHCQAGDEYVFECGVKWTSSGVYYDHRGRDPWRHATALPEIKTCGQLSDLVNALKGSGS